MLVDSLLVGFGIWNIPLLIAIVTLLLIYLLCKGNPFLTLKQPRGMQYDGAHVKEDRIIKMSFNEKRVPDDIDVIVIGSGMSGLMCAGCLSRMGKKVLILEQHDRAGGSTHTFEMQGFEFDVGLHYIGTMGDGEMNRTLLDAVTDGKLSWEKLDRGFDVVVLQNQDGVKHFQSNGDDSEYIKMLLKYFPGEQKAIEKYDTLLKECTKSIVAYALMKVLPKFVVTILLRTGLLALLFPRYKELSTRTVEEVLNELTDNPELKFVLSYAFGDYGTFPNKAPFLMHGMLMDHFRNGAYYPRGGSSKLASTMIPGILRAGGNVLVNANVDKILVNSKGEVEGVSVSKFGNSVEIKAPIVVSSAGILNTFRYLLPPTITDKSDKISLSRLDKGHSCFQTFIGLNGNAEELGLQRKNYWISNTVDVPGAMEEYFALSREEAVDARIPLAFISFPSTKDPSWRDRFSGKSVCTAVTFVNWSWFEEWDEQSHATTKDRIYDELKNGLQEQMKTIVVENFPQLKDKIAFIDSGTPLSHKHYLGSQRGEIYGIDHTMGRFLPDLATKLRPSTSIPGLYLTGQDIFTCGVMGAAVSGIITSGAIQGRNHFLDLYAAMGIQSCKRFWNRILRKT